DSRVTGLAPRRRARADACPPRAAPRRLARAQPSCDLRRIPRLPVRPCGVGADRALPASLRLWGLAGDTAPGRPPFASHGTVDCCGVRRTAVGCACGGTA